MSATVMLVFRTKAQKRAFIGGLLDGWGEGAPIGVSWDHGGTEEDGSSKIPATEAQVLRVRVYEDDE